MTKKEICVVIPIYKEHLSDFEIISVEQCVKVLSGYSIYFAAPKGLNVDFYKNKFSEITHFAFFDESYFSGIEGYNRLMLSVVFYKAFEDYQYMLIYQTDCFVFRDELLTWAEKDFDYIGGIWFENYHGNPYLGAKIWHAGNGGLSLRKIRTVTKLLSSKTPLKSFNQLLIEKRKLKKPGIKNYLRDSCLLLLHIFGFRNNYAYYADINFENEDVFFMEASLIYKDLKTPKVDEALGFSWDANPEYLLGMYGKLPFGCHAWFREDAPYNGNREFWLKQMMKQK